MPNDPAGQRLSSLISKWKESGSQQQLNEVKDQTYVVRVIFTFETSTAVEKMAGLQKRIERALRHVVGEDVSVRLAWAKKPKEEADF